jgi:uncharacterized surface protein with fasciclin (FAS1) repeats
MRRLLSAACTAALLFAPVAASAAADDVAPAASAAAPQTLAPHGDITDTLKASGQFTILTKALDATNMTPVLKGPGPFTVIAPTDAAFEAMPPGALDNLMKPENAQQLQALLTYHVINAAVPLSKIAGTKGPVQTTSGAKVQIDASGSPIKFNDADVTATSTTSNGSIYVVDKVLTPDGGTASISPKAAPAG